MQIPRTLRCRSQIGCCGLCAHTSREEITTLRHGVQPREGRYNDDALIEQGKHEALTLRQISCRSLSNGLYRTTGEYLFVGRGGSGAVGCRKTETPSEGGERERKPGNPTAKIRPHGDSVLLLRQH